MPDGSPQDVRPKLASPAHFPHPSQVSPRSPPPAEASFRRKKSPQDARSEASDDDPTSRTATLQTAATAAAKPPRPRSFPRRPRHSKDVEAALRSQVEL